MAEEERALGADDEAGGADPQSGEEGDQLSPESSPGVGVGRSPTGSQESGQPEGTSVRETGGPTGPPAGGGFDDPAVLKRWLIVLGMAVALVFGVLVGVLISGDDGGDAASGDAGGFPSGLPEGAEDVGDEHVDQDLGMGQVFDEDEETQGSGEGTVPQVDEADLEAMIEPWEPECPAEEGEEERHLQWAEPPPLCIDEARDYIATLVTSRGEIEIELDADNAPATVNNFVFLARWGYYDDTDFHAVFPDDTIQGGLPLGADGEVTDPGYTIEDELPDEAGGAAYPAYSVALGNAGEPDSGGGVFFITLHLGTMAPVYSRFGEVTDNDSRNVVNAIEDTGRRRAGGDGTPSEPTLIQRVVITAS